MIRLIKESDKDIYNNLGINLNPNFSKLFNLNEALNKDYNKIVKWANNWLYSSHS